jgi:branched-chain amino acid aminotransferase
MKIFIDGTLYGEEDAKVSVLGEAFLHGLGVRDYFGCRDGKFFCLDARLDQLEATARGVPMSFQWNRGDIKEALSVTYDMNGFNGRDALLELLLCSGSTSVENCQPSDDDEDDTAVVKKKESASNYGETKPSIVVIPREHTFQSEPLPGVKLVSLNGADSGGDLLAKERFLLGSLATALVRRMAKEKGGSEAILTNVDGFVYACSGGEIFIVSDGSILSPRTSTNARWWSVVSELLSDIGKGCSTQRLKLRDFSAASECFFLNNLGDICPVLLLNGEPIGDGKIGPIAPAIASDLSDKIRSSSKPAF